MERKCGGDGVILGRKVTGGSGHGDWEGGVEVKRFEQA
jgi:hypothetical protein